MLNWFIASTYFFNSNAHQSTPPSPAQVDDGLNFDMISELTDGFSGSDLRELCQTACRQATMDFAVELSRIPVQNTLGLKNEEAESLLEPCLKPVRMEDFMKALEHVHKTGGYSVECDESHTPPEQQKRLRTLAEMLLF